VSSVTGNHILHLELYVDKVNHCGTLARTAHTVTDRDTVDPDLRRYSDALESRRIQLGMSKAELARRAKVSESLIYKAVAGSVHVGDDSSARIDEALGWPTGTLQAVAAGDITPPEDAVTSPDRLLRAESHVDELRIDLADTRASLDVARQKIDGLAEDLGHMRSLVDELSGLVRQLPGLNG
jgi:transcriptional regulator with XRE-family HTH domain